MTVSQLMRQLSHFLPDHPVLVSVNGCFYFEVGRVSENVGGKVVEIEAVYNPKPREKTDAKQETINGIAQPVDKSQGVPVDNDAVQQTCK